MNQETKLTLALIQVENLVNLLDSNEYESFFYGHLMPIKVELERQLLLTKPQETTKIKE